MSKSDMAGLLLAVRQLSAALERPCVQHPGRPGKTYVHLPDDRQCAFREAFLRVICQEPDKLPPGVELLLRDLLEDLHQIPLWDADEPNHKIRKWLLKCRQIEAALSGQESQSSLGLKTSSDEDVEPDAVASEWVRCCSGRLLATPDFRMVRRTRDGVDFMLTPMQAMVVKHMAERSGRTVFTRDELLRACKSESSERSLYQIFKLTPKHKSSGRRKAWEDLIQEVEGTTDQYMLDL